MAIAALSPMLQRVMEVWAVCSLLGSGLAVVLTALSWRSQRALTATAQEHRCAERHEEALAAVARARRHTDELGDELDSMLDKLKRKHAAARRSEQAAAERIDQAEQHAGAGENGAPGGLPEDPEARRDALRRQWFGV